MAHSLEVRPPFLDHRIVQFAATLAVTVRVPGAEPAKAAGAIAMRAKARAMGTSDFFMISPF